MSTIIMHAVTSLFEWMSAVSDVALKRSIRLMVFEVGQDIELVRTSDRIKLSHHSISEADIQSFLVTLSAFCQIEREEEPLGASPGYIEYRSNLWPCTFRVEPSDNPRRISCIVEDSRL